MRRKTGTRTRRRRTSRAWVYPSEFSHKKTSRSEGEESKHVVETSRTHVVPALCVSIPIWNDDERGRLWAITYVTRCVVGHRVCVCVCVFV